MWWQNMLLREINPFVRQAINCSISSNAKYDVFNELQSADCRLFYMISGEGSMVIEGHKYDLNSGDCILFQSGTKYIWQINEQHELNYISINFDYTHNFYSIKKPFHPVHSNMFSPEDILENITFYDCPALNNHIVLPASNSYESKFRRIVTEYYLGGDFSDELLSSLLKSLVISIVRELNGNDKNPLSNNFELTRKIMQYIQNNYAQEISYESIAKSFHLNPIYANRVFKKISGVSLYSFLINYRIDMAMELLRSTNIEVKEIAFMVGFSDLPHFIKTFKKHTGKTPSKYRNSSE
ncbi:MAG: AraC family transcriptional regulator [Ruminococcaceae bacterium]|nr:AraC family transcriptional regulator [Oscillospiraceae bacterium]